MEAFTLDVSGAIRLVPAASDPDGPIYTWSGLSPFEQGYIEGLFGKPCADCPPADYPTDATRCALCNRRKGFSDLAPETLARIMEDCERFAATYDASRLTGRERAAGRAFWVTRNRIFGGTVAGSFYDDAWNGRLSLDAMEGDHLALVAKTFPPLTVTLNDDGRVYLREAK